MWLEARASAFWALTSDGLKPGDLVKHTFSDRKKAPFLGLRIKDG
jgi:hypothetical protein